MQFYTLPPKTEPYEDRKSKTYYRVIRFLGFVTHSYDPYDPSYLRAKHILPHEKDVATFAQSLFRPLPDGWQFKGVAIHASDEIADGPDRIRQMVVPSDTSKFYKIVAIELVRYAKRPSEIVSAPDALAAFEPLQLWSERLIGALKQAVAFQRERVANQELRDLAGSILWHFYAAAQTSASDRVAFERRLAGLRAELRYERIQESGRLLRNIVEHSDVPLEQRLFLWLGIESGQSVPPGIMEVVKRYTRNVCETDSGPFSDFHNPVAPEDVAELAHDPKTLAAIFADYEASQTEPAPDVTIPKEGDA